MSKVSSKKIWVVGDRIITPANQRGLVTSADKKIGITWENGHLGEYTPKQIQAYGYQKFLEEKEAIAPCNNLTSVQELAQDFAMQVYNSDSSLSETQRLTNTAQASSNCDIPTYTTTETCEKSQIVQNTNVATICTQEESISSQLPHPAPHSPQKANDLEVQTSEIVSPPSLKPSENYNLDSQPLKTSQDLSPAPIIQDSPRVHISEEWSEPLTSSGTMRNGWLSEAATLPAPTLENEYCWLRSPGALSLSGKGRPPGQTKQEAELKKLGLINKGEVLNPAILCQWYEIPETWLDPLECRAATELLEVNAQQQEIFSILELPALPLTESSTSTPCVENQSASPQQQLKQSDIKIDLYICNSSSNIGKIIEVWQTCFTVDWSGEIKCYFWERDEQVIGELALAQPAAGIAPQPLIDQFFSQGETLKRKVSRGEYPPGDGSSFSQRETRSANKRGNPANGLPQLCKKAIEENHPQLCTRCLKVVDRGYTCEKCPPMERTQQLQVGYRFRRNDGKNGVITKIEPDGRIHSVLLDEAGKASSVFMCLLPDAFQKTGVYDGHIFLEEIRKGDRIFSCKEVRAGTVSNVNQSKFSINWDYYKTVTYKFVLLPKLELVDECFSTPEIFLEETKAQPEAVQKPKGRQRKGCLYKYIENKKLKNGAIASYPRVIGHRHPDNPTHWRWGFNWEEKVDGEWKGRSIGSVPLGAIALIQSMQNEGVSLEEIIGFIKRAKAKK